MTAVAKKGFMENFAKKVIEIQTGPPVQVRTTNYKRSGYLKFICVLSLFLTD